MPRSRRKASEANCKALPLLLTATKATSRSWRTVADAADKAMPCSATRCNHWDRGDTIGRGLRLLSVLRPPLPGDPSCLTPRGLQPKPPLPLPLFKKSFFVAGDLRGVESISRVRGESGVVARSKP